ncbi:MAG: hypothetical protein HRU03_03085 [Nanoarchaeales archaeon]|nr:hypothetical protein [Nanoarchaeales archaeon]
MSADWKTLNTKVIDAGGNNFIEVTLKQAPEEQDMFIGFSKGWTNSEGLKRYKSNVLFKIAQKKELFDAVEEMLSLAEEKSSQKSSDE